MGKMVVSGLVLSVPGTMWLSDISGYSIGTIVFGLILAAYIVIGICIFLPDSGHPEKEIKVVRRRKKKGKARTSVNNLKRRLPWAGERPKYGRRSSTRAGAVPLSTHK